MGMPADGRKRAFASSDFLGVSTARMCVIGFFDPGMDCALTSYRFRDPFRPGAGRVRGLIIGGGYG